MHPKMKNPLQQYLLEHREEAYTLFRRYLGLGKPFLLHSDVEDGLREFYNRNPDSSGAPSLLRETLRHAQEAAMDAPWIYMAVRLRIGKWEFFRFHVETVAVEEITGSEYLSAKERLINGYDHSSEWNLEINLTPFNRSFPKLRESRSIGQGVRFLNRRLCSELFQELDKGDKRLLKFLRVHQIRGKQLMLNDRLEEVTDLRKAIRTADKFLQTQPPDAEWDSVGDRMQEFGFEPGWGNTVDRIRDTLGLLSDILEAPEPSTFERFLGRIPMIFDIVILSPHGFFGQSNVLGMPDTGGQVVYILDQVRALEKEMRQRLTQQGIDIEPQILVITRLIPDAQGTTCDQRTENILGTKNARILRIPFRNAAGEIIPQWISRFEIWPYLERFTLDTEKDILAELGGRPDLIVGNYSDGNLVASLLSQRLHVTQCNIAHALEKTKYLFSDLYWKDNEDRYHFSCQFSADLIAMNSADFIITSTYQEIAGTQDSVGQYESYSSFTMPDLFRVVDGIDIYDPKFNIVSPGADADIYFPHADKNRRLTGLHAEMEDLVFGKNDRPEVFSHIKEKTKPLLFTMARFDRIKNIVGLAEWYGSSPRLRELANLLIVGGQVDAGRSNDHEEREQVERLHDLIDKYDMIGDIRWVPFQTERVFVGELYRFVADHRGIFIQPALFEAFGLSVVEAMSSGLPTFATKYGGPSEIIEHNVSGFHIDPNRGEEIAQLLIDFLEECDQNPNRWDAVGQAGIDRIQAKYTWELYAERMMTLARVYGFWKYVTNLDREETRLYLQMLYSLQYRPLAEKIHSDST
jgi:sucrose synthase